MRYFSIADVPVRAGILRVAPGPVFLARKIFRSLDNAHGHRNSCKLTLVGLRFAAVRLIYIFRGVRRFVMIGSSMAFSILFPSGYSVEVSRLRQQLDEAHLSWKTERKRWQAEFRIENVRFVHDPRWNKRILSLQAARDGETWFWRATHTIVVFGGFSI